MWAKVDAPIEQVRPKFELEILHGRTLDIRAGKIAETELRAGKENRQKLELLILKTGRPRINLRKTKIDNNKGEENHLELMMIIKAGKIWDHFLTRNFLTQKHFPKSKSNFQEKFCVKKVRVKKSKYFVLKKFRVKKTQQKLY